METLRPYTCRTHALGRLVCAVLILVLVQNARGGEVQDECPDEDHLCDFFYHCCDFKDYHYCCPDECSCCQGTNYGHDQYGCRCPGDRCCGGAVIPGDYACCPSNAAFGYAYGCPPDTDCCDGWFPGNPYYDGRCTPGDQPGAQCCDFGNGMYRVADGECCEDRPTSPPYYTCGEDLSCCKGACCGGTLPQCCMDSTGDPPLGYCCRTNDECCYNVVPFAGRTSGNCVLEGFQCCTDAPVPDPPLTQRPYACKDAPTQQNPTEGETCCGGSCCAGQCLTSPLDGEKKCCDYGDDEICVNGETDFCCDGECCGLAGPEDCCPDGVEKCCFGDHCCLLGKICCDGDGENGCCDPATQQCCTDTCCPKNHECCLSLTLSGFCCDPQQCLTCGSSGCEPMSPCADCGPDGTDPMPRCIQGQCLTPACSIDPASVTVCPGIHDFFLTFICTNPCPTNESVSLQVDGTLPTWITNLTFFQDMCNGNDPTLVMGRITVAPDTPFGTTASVPIKMTGVGTAECTRAIEFIVGISEIPDIEIVYKTFISPPAIAGPKLAFDYEGDNRCFSSTATPSRTRQHVTISLDPAVAPNGIVGTPTMAFGTTVKYDAIYGATGTTNCNGCVSDARFITPLVPTACTATPVSGVAGNLLSVDSMRLGTGELEVQLDQAAKNMCVVPLSASPAIDVHLTIQFRVACSQFGDPPVVQFRLWGTHDGYPWHELYINGVPVYWHDPCLGQNSPWSLYGSTGDRCYSCPTSFNFAPWGQPLDEWHQVPGT